MSREVALLHPELQEIVTEFLSLCLSKGLPVIITQTWRSKQEQDQLYAQGRTKPGSIVTNCKYPLSPHCWGVAFDFCRNVRGREYDDSDGFFKKVGAVGKGLGLAWGGDWKGFVDKPHLELAKYLPGNSVSQLQKQYGTPENFKKTWRTAKKEVYRGTFYMINKTAILVNGEKVEMERILYEDTNYIKLRELEKIGIKVTYDNEKKMPVLTF